MGTLTTGLIAMLIGILPGLLLFEWIASPFGPSLWVLTTPFTRVFLTLSQFIRGKGVLVKRESGEYEIGTYVNPADAESYIQLSDTTLPVDADNLVWGLFGKRDFGMTWEPGTDLHDLIAGDTDPLAYPDGGEMTINMAALHRYLDGTNEADAITRTEEHSKAEYGGGSDGISEKAMAGLVILMILMGTMTSYFMLG